MSEKTRGAVALTVGSVLRGTILNYVSFIGCMNRLTAIRGGTIHRCIDISRYVSRYYFIYSHFFFFFFFTMIFI